MKKLLILLFVLAANPAFAETFVSDDFSTDGTLGGSTPFIGETWVRISGTVGEMQVVGNRVQITDADSEDVESGFGSTLTTGNLYYGYDFSFADPGSYSGTDYEYYAHFSRSNSFPARTDIAGISALGFTPGISSGTATADVVWASNLDYDTDYRLVVGYNFTSGLSSLWIDPVSEGSTSIVTTTAATGKSIDAFNFRQTGATPNVSISIGQLRVGTTFADALVSDTYTVPSGDTTTATGVLSGTGGIIKEGAGTLLVSGSENNTFTGAVVVNVGTLELANSSGNAVHASSGVAVAGGATLLISSSNQVADTIPITLSGGTISRSSGVSETMGTLDLSAASVIDYVSGTSGTLAFGAYESGSTPSHVLTVNNFADGNVLSFGTDLSSYLPSTEGTSFSNSYFALNGMGAGGFTSAWDSGSSTFTITSVPEPSTYVAGGLLLLLMGGSFCRRRLAKVRG